MLDASDEVYYFNRLAGEDNLLSILHPVHTSAPPCPIDSVDTPQQYDAECSSFAAQLIQPLQDQTPVACSVIVTNYRIIIIACHGSKFRYKSSLPFPAGAPPNPKRYFATRSYDFDNKSKPRVDKADEESVRNHAESIRKHYHTQLSHSAVFSIPHMSIDSAKAEGTSKGTCVTVSSKHFWQFKILFTDASHGSRMVQLLNSLQAQTLAQLPAFDYFKARARGGAKNAGSDESMTRASEMDFGWSVFQEDREYERQLTQNYAASIPNGPELHETGRAGQGADLRPWFRLTTLLEKEVEESDPNLPLPITPFIASVGSSPTYPVKVCVPNAASDRFIVEECLATRSRGRIPAVSFVNLRTGAVLARSSQPLNKKNVMPDSKYCNFLVNHYTAYNCKPREEQVAVQIQSTLDRKAAPPSLLDSSPVARRAPPSLTDVPRRLTDENEVKGPDSTAVVSSGARHLNIIDCRPKSAAMGNQAVGGGVESYDFCKVGYYNIENIHAVTSSFSKMKALIHNFSGRNQRSDFLSQLQETGWFFHLSCLLTCAEKVVAFLERGESCLVHCTDGWDRTSQITALSMVLSDPFYRTVRGFACLVEKEFGSFGHKFAERLGHMRPGSMTAAADSGVSASDTESSQVTQNHKQQPSPVFPQFLDAMFQLVSQFPTEFEFTENLLAFIADHCYSCYYGTFLCNAQKERLFEGITVSTCSIWTDVLLACHLERIGKCEAFFLQPDFKSKEYAMMLLKSSRELPRALRLNSSSKNIRLWESFYLRDDPDRWQLPLTANYRKRSAEVLGASSRPENVEFLPPPSYAPWEAEQASKQVSGTSNLYNPAFMAWNSDELAIMIAHRSVESCRHLEIRKRFKESSVNSRPQLSSSSSNFEAKPTSTESALGTMGVGAGATRQCWICNSQFGIFATKYYCSECNVKAPICSGCVQTDPMGRKLCRNCFGIAGK